ncbi:uncharacterized protein LOC108906292, partial [Anoplophora glabripennis]|uniref:uncharacterized protein LOC108906292 n=1 Tax=Anoplophora glabripennis TaxID=217634 RepID=UPI00087549CA
MESNLCEVVKKYKCSVCDCLLSILPISIANVDGKNDNELYKCGRCHRINCEEYSWTRIRLFEEMAQNLSFPCSYPPCMEMLPWSKVEQHEGNCHYKTIKCPVCLDEMLIDDLGEHITDKHKEHVKKGFDGNGWEVNRYNNYMFFVEVDSQYFFVYIRQWNRAVVMSTKLSKFTKCNVKLKFGVEDNYAVSIDNLPVIPYNNNIHKMHTNSFTNNLSNRFSDIIGKTSRNYPIIRFYVTLIADESIDEKGRKEQEQNPVQFNVEINRKALTCPYCVTYMAAPIFACVSGHTICMECKSRLEKCPTCQASLDGPRNYTLEEMADDVEIPCQFNINGCPL